jgi:choline dehydrogenase-like flavoprotein
MSSFSAAFRRDPQGEHAPLAGMAAQISRHAIDFYAMSEDIPHPESRIMVDGDRIVLKWHRSNWDAHLDLVARLKGVLRKAGFPVVLSRPFDKRTPSHQCGTVKMGNDPATSPLDTFCRSLRSPESFRRRCELPADLGRRQSILTVAAQALRVADYIRREELA